MLTFEHEINNRKVNVVPPSGSVEVSIIDTHPLSGYHSHINELIFLILNNGYIILFKNYLDRIHRIISWGWIDDADVK